MDSSAQINKPSPANGGARGSGCPRCALCRDGAGWDGALLRCSWPGTKLQELRHSNLLADSEPPTGTASLAVPSARAGKQGLPNAAQHSKARRGRMGRAPWHLWASAAHRWLSPALLCLPVATMMSATAGAPQARLMGRQIEF